MSKKQQIILTHGVGLPSDDVKKGLKLGEVLVQHAETAKDTSLHTVITEGEDAVLVSFPSQEWVKAEIDKVDAAGIGDAIDSLEQQIANEVTAREKAISDEVTAREKAISDEVTAREEAISGLQGTLEGQLESAVEELTGAIGGVEGIANAKVDETTYNAKMQEIDGDITTLKEVVEGYTGKGSVKTAIDSKVDGTVYSAKMQEIDGELDGISAQFESLEDTFYTEEEIDGKVAELQANIDKAQTDITGVEVDGVGIEVSGEEQEDGRYKYTVKAKGFAKNDDLTALGEVVAGIQGNDEAKSMRDVAVEVLAEQLIPEGAAESLNTLQEIAAWIQSHPEDASQMNNEINSLKDVTDGYTTKGEIKSTIDAVDGRLAKVEEDYLKEADKTEITGLITAEQNARVKAIEDEAALRVAGDAAINEQIGSGFTKEKTVADAISALEDALGSLEDTFYTEEEIDGKVVELQDEIKKAQTNITGVETNGVGIEVSGEEQEDGRYKYTVEAKGFAKNDDLTAVDGRLATVEGTYIKAVTYKNADGAVTSIPVNENIVDLSGIVIDGGTY